MSAHYKYMHRETLFSRVCKTYWVMDYRAFYEMCHKRKYVSLYGTLTLYIYLLVTTQTGVREETCKIINMSNEKKSFNIFEKSLTM